MDNNKETNTKKKIETNKFVIFQLGQEEYGLDILKVQEIISYKNVTPLPNVPDYVKGVINLRGAVIPIIDLRLRFNMPGKEYDLLTVIIVTEIHNRIMGLVVDTVSSVDSLSGEELQDNPMLGSNVNTRFIKAMGKKDDRLIIILDIENALTSEEVFIINKSKPAEKIEQS